MRKAAVYVNGHLSGYLIEGDDRTYLFRYEKTWLNNQDNDAVSLTLPKQGEDYCSGILFPFFSNMLSEGMNKATQCRKLRIDENDHFGLLVATAGIDTIGAVTVKEINEL